jgi:Chaperone of endosialidase
MPWQSKSDWVTNPRNPTWQDLQNYVLDQGRSGTSSWGGDVDAGGHSLLNIQSLTTSTGNFGIGATSPATTLNVSATGADTNVLIDAANQTTYNPLLSFRELSVAVWNIGLDTNDSQKLKIATGGTLDNLRTGAVMTITTGGSVGIGTTSPASQLHVRVGTNQNLLLGTSSGSATLQATNDPVNTWVPMQYLASGHYFLHGNVGIGTTSPSYLIQLSSDSAAKPSTSTWTVSSDARTKRNIQPATEDPLALLNALSWVRYEYNGLGGTPEGAAGLGLVAQDVRAHLPEAVRSHRAKLNGTDAEETDILGLDYHTIIVHTARAIQQLDARLKKAGL